jgi:hypothetical protein
MKRISIIISVLVALVFTSCENKRELYKQVDYFVEQLDTYYSRYDAYGKHSTSVVCGNTIYNVSPMGRLIVVKINKYVPSSEYEKLSKSLERRYKNDNRVNDVYINRAGTVVVDCRN